MIFTLSIWKVCVILNNIFLTICSLFFKSKLMDIALVLNYFLIHFPICNYEVSCSFIINKSIFLAKNFSNISFIKRIYCANISTDREIK